MARWSKSTRFGGRWRFRQGMLALLGAACFAGPARAEGETTPAPVPDEAAVGEAMKLVKEVFQEHYDAADTPEEKCQLARRLLGAAKQAPDDAASQYALLIAARAVAAAAGDAKQTLEVVEALAEAFRVDYAAEAAAALDAVSSAARSREQQRDLAKAAMEAADRAVAEDALEKAAELGQIAVGGARRARDGALVQEAAALSARVRKAAAARAAIRDALARLRADPVDPAANQAVGEYYCFGQGDWEKGLAMLALGRDAALAGLARQELEPPGTPEEQLALADAWWAAAGGRSPEAAEAMRRRAGAWYQKAMPGLTGLVKVKATKRLEEVEKESGHLPSAVMTLADRAVTAELAHTISCGFKPSHVLFLPQRPATVAIVGGQEYGLWDATTGKAVAEVAKVAVHARTAICSGELLIIAGGHPEEAVAIVRLDSGKTRLCPVGHEASVRVLAVSPDGALAATGDFDGKVVIWEIESGKVRHTIPGDKQFVCGLAFSPDSRLLACSRVGKDFELWATHDGSLVRTLKDSDTSFTYLAFSPDGRLLVSAESVGIRLRNAVTGAVVATIGGNEDSDGFEQAHFIAGGAMLVSGARDGALQIWGVASQRELFRASAHDHVWGMDVDPSGAMIATASPTDGMVKIWRVRHGRTYRSPKPVPAARRPDGKNPWLGTWREGDGFGGFHVVTILPEGVARRGNVAGRWYLAGEALVMEWPDRWKGVWYFENGRILKKAYFGNKSLSDPPSNTDIVTRVGE